MTPNFVIQIILANVTPNAWSQQNLARSPPLLYKNPGSAPEVSTLLAGHIQAKHRGSSPVNVGGHLGPSNHKMTTMTTTD